MTSCTVFSVKEYGAMMADTVRMDAYARALALAVGTDSVVVDLGAGTGIMSLLACKLGARRVFAIEPGDAIEVAKVIAADLGYAERIHFIREISTNVTLPERANVIVSDLRGVLPLFEQHLPSVTDARKRFLADGGIMIPERDTVWVAIVEAPKAYAEIVDPWGAASCGLNMSSARRFVTNERTKLRPGRDQLLTEQQCWIELDYSRDLPIDYLGKIDFRVTRGGTGHGVLVWFDSVLADNVEMSNAPGLPKLIYGSSFFPWTTEVQLDEGDDISICLRADLAHDDYLWVWDTKVHARASRQCKADFKQSTFLGHPMSPASLSRRASSFVPVTGEDGEIDRLALQAMDGTRSIGEIAEELVARFPARFRTRGQAVARVGDLTEKYGRRG